MRPANFFLRPHIDAITAAIGNGCSLAPAGACAKATGGKDTGIEQIVGIYLGLVFLIGIMHQAIHINAVACRDLQHNTNDLIAVSGLITLKQAYGNAATIPAIAQVFKDKLCFLGSLPLVISQLQTCLGRLVTKVEISMYRTLGHAGQCRQRTVLNSQLRIKGKYTGFCAVGYELQRTNTSLSLQMRRNILAGFHHGHTGIRCQIDPVILDRLQFHICIGIIVFQGVHTNHRIIGNTREVQTNANNIVAATRTDTNFIHIQFAVIPATANRFQCKLHSVADFPVAVDQIQRNLGRHILKLEIAGELTAGHIQLTTQFCNSLGIQTDKAVSLTLLARESRLQGADRAFACVIIIVITCGSTLPTFIHNHIFPTLIQGLVGHGIGGVDLRIHGSRYYIQIIQIEIVGICIGQAIICILHLNSQVFRRKLILHQQMLCT